MPVSNELEVTWLSGRVSHGHDRHVKGEDFNGRMIIKVEVLRIHCWEFHHQLGDLIVLNKPPHRVHFTHQPLGSETLRNTGLELCALDELARLVGVFSNRNAAMRNNLVHY